jgi:hypothetical protein
VVAKFSAPVQTDPRAHPISCTMDRGSFPQVNRQGRSVNHPRPPNAEVKERVELYICYLSVPSWHVIGSHLLLIFLLPNFSKQTEEYLFTYLEIYVQNIWALLHWKNRIMLLAHCMKNCIIFLYVSRK